MKIRPTVIEIYDLRNFTFQQSADAKQRKNWQTSCPLQTFFSNISRHLEFITEQGHRVNWVSGSLDSRLTGSLVAYLSIGLALFPFPLDFQLPSAVPFLPSLWNYDPINFFLPKNRPVQYLQHRKTAIKYKQSFFRSLAHVRHSQ